MLPLLARIGRRTLDALGELLAITMLVYAAVKGAAIERPRGDTLVRRSAATQLYFTAVEPLGLFVMIAVVCGFAVIVLADALMRPNGLAPHVPTVVAQSVVRELLPLVIALVVIGRSGPAIATELGYMRVNHEIDALDAAGVNVDYFVVLPRLVGVTLATIGLTITTSAAALLGGFALGRVLGLVSVGLSLEQILEAVTPGTIVYSLVKSTLFGLVIAAVNSFHGLSVKRSFTEIPRANVRGAVQCYLACVCLDGVLVVHAMAGSL